MKSGCAEMRIHYFFLARNARINTVFSVCLHLIYPCNPCLKYIYDTPSYLFRLSVTFYFQ